MNFRAGSRCASTAMQFLAIASTSLLCAPALAGAIVQQKMGATLEVQFEADQPRIALSDTVVVKLTIEGSSNLKIAPPRKFPAGAPWQLDGTTTPFVEEIGKGRLRWQQTFRCSPREPGKIPFAFPAVPIRDGEADLETITFDPIDFVVTTHITQPDRRTLRDGIDVEAVPPPASSERWSGGAWLVVPCLAALGIALYFVRRYLRRRTRRSPHERALYEMRRLLAMKLPERGRQERFITLLTLLLRDYLERDLDLPVRKQTTSEFLIQVADHPSLGETDKRFLADFLRDADAVKFAQVEISVKECQAWAEKLHHFLQARVQISSAKTGQASKNSPVEKFGQSG